MAADLSSRQPSGFLESFDSFMSFALLQQPIAEQLEISNGGGGLGCARSASSSDYSATARSSANCLGGIASTSQATTGKTAAAGEAAAAEASTAKT